MCIAQYNQIIRRIIPNNPPYIEANLKNRPIKSEYAEESINQQNVENAAPGITSLTASFLRGIVL